MEKEIGLLIASKSVFLNWLLGFNVGILVFLFLRFIAIRWQAGRAIRKELARRQQVLIRFKRATCFICIDYSSIREAFLSGLRHFQVYARSGDGMLHEHLFEIDFVPLVGILREVDVVSDYWESVPIEKPTDSL